MPWSQAHVRVESSGQPPEQGDGGLGAALFDALDFIGGHVSPASQVGNAQIQGAALIVYGLAEASASRMAIRSGSSACSGRRTQRVW